MKELISEIVERPLFDDDGCTYVEYTRYTYAIDHFVFIAKYAVRKKKELFNKLYELQTAY